MLELPLRAMNPNIGLHLARGRGNGLVASRHKLSSGLARNFPEPVTRRAHGFFMNATPCFHEDIHESFHEAAKSAVFHYEAGVQVSFHLISRDAYRFIDHPENLGPHARKRTAAAHGREPGHHDASREGAA